MIANLNPKLRGADLPYVLRFYDVTEELFNELVDEDTKAELLDGVMIVHSPASPQHDDLDGFLRAVMRYYAEDHGLGKVLGPNSLIHLATCRKFAPDLFFLSAAQLPESLPEDEIDVIPDLVVEVLSRSNRDYDLLDKRPAYQQAGIPELWFVDRKAKEVIVDRRSKKRYTSTTVSNGRITCKALPGFWLECAWLWAKPIPSVPTCLRRIAREQAK